MILVDTNVIIDYWKVPDDWTTKIFKKEDIAICGVVEAELIHGARSDKDIRNIITAISGFEMLSYSGDWEKLGRMLYKLRVSGVTLPVTDVLIAQIAIDHRVAILSRDNHFRFMKNVFSELQLYPAEIK